MRFLARLKKGSMIDRELRKFNRVGVARYGIAFKLAGTIEGGYYASGEISATQVAELRNRKDVEIETIGTIPLHAAALALPGDVPGEIIKPKNKGGRPRKHPLPVAVV